MYPKQSSKESYSAVFNGDKHYDFIAEFLRYTGFILRNFGKSPMASTHYVKESLGAEGSQIQIINKKTEYSDYLFEYYRYSQLLSGTFIFTLYRNTPGTRISDPRKEDIMQSIRVEAKYTRKNANRMLADLIQRLLVDQL